MDGWPHTNHHRMVLRSWESLRLSPFLFILKLHALEKFLDLDHGSSRNSSSYNFSNAYGALNNEESERGQPVWTTVWSKTTFLNAFYRCPTATASIPQADTRYWSSHWSCHFLHPDDSYDATSNDNVTTNVHATHDSGFVLVSLPTDNCFNLDDPAT
ncbi:hypothetical protein L6452_42171 [Arctium lappa]|uniref:Uncharacterized protein n=1 Tax=Arctium lappa TaxID=4217 RepID=A0ACB8XGZ9_ARCLA|nr:hypothetical protein L6452_42171 [Arctium lappa]